MTFEIHEKPAQLDKYIESIFYFKDYVSEHKVERVIPTENIFLLIELDGFERTTFNNDLQTIIENLQNKYIISVNVRRINCNTYKIINSGMRK